MCVLIRHFANPRTVLLYCDIEMKDWIVILFALAIPIIGITVWIIQEILDFILNKRKVEQMLLEAEKVSFESIEQNILNHREKLNSLDEWTQKKLEIMKRNRELDEKERKTYYVREKKAIRAEQLTLEKKSNEITELFSTKRWGKGKTKWEIAVEKDLRNIFNPH